MRDARHEFGAAIMDQEKHLCGKRIPTSLTRVASIAIAVTNRRWWPSDGKPSLVVRRSSTRVVPTIRGVKGR